MKVAIIYHSSCMDGAAAAWAMGIHTQRAGHEPVYIPAQPDTFPETDCPVKVFVDMCPPPGSMTEDVWVFDHHKTAKERLAPYRQGFYTDTMSGAVMAWHMGPLVFGGKYLHDDPPEVLLFVQDRDLWAWKLPDSKAVSAAMWKDVPTPEHIDMLDRTWSWVSISRAGKEMLAYQEALVEQAANRAYPGTILGIEMMVVNCPLLHSEIGNAVVIRFQKPCLVWRVLRPGVIECSFRSMDHLPDISGVAKVFGGGGHRNAAGFSVSDLTDLFNVDIARPSS